MPDRIFTLKEWKRIKRDVYDDWFGQQNINYDLKELMEAGMFGEGLGEPTIEPALRGETNIG